MILRAAECDVQETAGLILIGKGSAIAGHDDHAFAFQPLCLVNGADSSFRRLGPLIDAAVGDFGKAIFGAVVVAQAGRLPKFAMAIDLDVGEVRIAGGQFRKPSEHLGHTAVVGLVYQKAR